MTNSTIETIDCIEKSKRYAITSATAGSVSFFCSSIIVCILLRSHARLSKTYHRLLFGMSIGDMISSSVYMMSTAVVPKDVDYMVWNARGNMASCDMQGFMAILGIFVTFGYNCSLCLFYLAVIKFKKKDDYIRTKLEPWMHAVSVTVALALAIAGLISQVYNPGLVNCFVSTYNPPHCKDVDKDMDKDVYICMDPMESDMITPDDHIDTSENDEHEIPCDRGWKNYHVFYYILLAKNLALLPGFIFGSMIMMYREVLKTEKKMEQYGVGTLRIGNTHARADEDDIEASASLSRRLLSITSRFSRVFGRSHHRASTTCIGSSSMRMRTMTSSGRSNHSNRNIRMVMYRALAYAMAYIATYLFPIIFSIERLVNKEKPPQFRVWLYLAFVFHPLQGLFNFMIFMYPRIMMAKKSSLREVRSWYQAFMYALAWRGEKKVNRKRRRVPPAHRPSASQKRSYRRKKKNRRELHHRKEEEEEKCEIEGPRSLPYSLPSSARQ